jgi:hypothetical protein
MSVLSHLDVNFSGHQKIAIGGRQFLSLFLVKPSSQLISHDRYKHHDARVTI